MRTVAWLLCVSWAALAEEPAKDYVLTNKAKDITLVAAQEQSIADYFKANRLVVGYVLADKFKALREATKPSESLLLNYASFNDDLNKESLFGAHLRVAPFTPALAKLANEHKEAPTMILRPDPKEKDLYHVVGFTSRTPVGFFANDKKNAMDGFAQTDLRFQPKK